VSNGGKGRDLVVVGGGVYGTGVAWELSRAGADVLLLEAGSDVASGASGGTGTRGVRANERSDAELPIMKLAIESWPELATLLGDTAIFRRIGGLEFVETAEARADAEARAVAQTQAGLPTRIVEGTELRLLEPNLSDVITAAMYREDDGVSDHTATTRALAREADKLGTGIRRGVRVAALEVSGGRVSALSTEQGERIAVVGQLLLAANAGSAELVAAALGLRLPLFNVLPQILVTEPLAEPVTAHLVGHLTRPFHMKMLTDGRAMISGGFLGEASPCAGSGQTVPWAVAGNLAEAARVYPMLAGVELELAFADRFESIAPDQLPIIDVLPGAGNLLLCAGSSGQGWAPAPAYVKLIAEWLRTGSRPELLTPFAHARFT